MDDLERKFRHTPLGHKKYHKRLSDFISFLISKGRILEARYYFQILIQSRPNNLRANMLGYEISIKSFDNEGVARFDRFLCDNAKKVVDVQVLQLEYYYSVNNAKGFLFVLEYILLTRLKPDVLNKVIGLVVTFESYASITKLLSYLKKNKLILNAKADARIKKTVLQEFSNVLVRIKL
ncbi:hypothetical protein PKO51_19480 [Yokenella regensburgei]|nr:hypothetical protein [Yokenella regensburgei]